MPALSPPYTGRPHWFRCFRWSVGRHLIEVPKEAIRLHDQLVELRLVQRLQAGRLRDVPSRRSPVARFGRGWLVHNENVYGQDIDQCVEQGKSKVLSEFDIL